jgi:hypothetical protein
MAALTLENTGEETEAAGATKSAAVQKIAPSTTAIAASRIEMMLAPAS